MHKPFVFIWMYYSFEQQENCVCIDSVHEDAVCLEVTKGGNVLLPIVAGNNLFKFIISAVFSAGEKSTMPYP